MYTLYTLALVCIASINIFGYEFSHTIKKIDQNKALISLTFALKPGEYLYKESLITSVNSPHIKLSAPEPSAKAVSFFDESAKKEKEGYKDTVSFTFTAQKAAQADVTNAVIHTHFTLNTVPESQEKIISLEFMQPATMGKRAPSTAQQAPQQPKQALVTHAPSCEPQQPSLLGSFIQKTINWVRVNITHAKDKITTTFTSTGSHFLRFGAALVLGVLLSLTPCIYPMIPITVGILQASGTPSAFKNFLLALSYTLGISTTFALLGFVAALGSCVFGEMQGSPWVVIPLATLLIYFGLSMFDWVQLYIPRFLQPKTGKVKGGSPLSAFIFGAISGTIASPCLSPGLVLILNYVTNSGAQHFTGYIEGFLLLFIFGIGSSLPLLIIGTFSSSLHILPKAGMWMVEIKKIVGLMLICMAFYHLSHLERLLPWYLFVWVIVLSFFALGIYYFVSIGTHDRTAMKRYKNLMGTALIVLACIMMVQGQKAVYDHLYPYETASVWLHDYDKARETAQKEHKLLFVDIGATYCAACKSLDQQIFTQEKMLKELSKFVQLKIESDVHTDAYEKIKAVANKLIEGFPTYLIVDPVTQQVLKKWSVEIDELSIDGIVDEFEKVRNSHMQKSGS